MPFGIQSGRSAGGAFRRTALSLSAALVAAAGLLAACGSERTRAPNLARPADPGGFERFRSPGGDVKLPRPVSWAAAPGKPPSVVTFGSGDATLAVWAYPRVAVPETETEVELAKRLLVRSLRRRAPEFELTGTRVTEVGDALAVELQGRGRIARHPVRVRSLHLYKGEGEYVVDAYAEPSQFGAADRMVFRRVMKAIRVGGDPRRISEKLPESETPTLPPTSGGR